MTTFKELAEAWIASREHCSGSLGRIRFWVDEFGPLQVDQISEDQVDQTINRLVARGKLQGGTGKPAVNEEKAIVELTASSCSAYRTITGLDVSSIPGPQVRILSERNRFRF